MKHIYVTPAISIAKSELKEEFIRATGPGGQNVNKVATAVQLRFDVVNSPSLPEEVRRNLFRLASGQITGNGVLIIDARRFRTQARNRLDALNRLVLLIRKAAQKRKIRKPIKPSLKAKERRLEAKRRRSKIKRLRRYVKRSED